MSGQPVQTQGDVNKYHNQYMETLGLQQSINDMNLQANKNYLLTGTMPAVSQMKDSRTTTEILADVEKIKSNIAIMISKVADIHFGYGVVNGLINSPLNVDNKLITFMAQKGDEIILKLKKEYKLGIKGDINDIDVFVKFIEDYFNKSFNTVLSIKDYMSSISSGPKSQINRLTIDPVINDIKNLIKHVDVKLSHIYAKYKHRRPADLNIATGKLKDLSLLLSELKNYLLDDDELNILLNIIQTNQGLETHELDELHAVFNIIEKLPLMSTVTTLLNMIQTKIDTSSDGNIGGIVDTINRLVGLFSEFINPESLAMMVRVNRYIRNNIPPQNRNIPQNIARGQQFAPTLGGLDTNTAIGNVPRNAAQNEPENDINVNPFNLEMFDNWNDNLDTIDNYIMDVQNGIPIDNRRNIQYMNEMKPYVRTMDEEFGIHTVNDEKNKMNNPTIQNLIYISHYIRHFIEHRMHPNVGGGLMKKTQKPKRSNFRGFGIAEINHKKLDMGILSIRRPSKGNYKSVPQQRISPTLQNIIKDINGGKVPNFNDINSLTSDEKEYLHKVVCASGFDEKFSIPTPNKDAMEKEIHQFEVLKGEIMSGNDSKALIKKFKILILKLANKGSLGKKEANDVLYTLLSLGY